MDYTTAEIFQISKAYAITVCNTKSSPEDFITEMNKMQNYLSTKTESQEKSEFEFKGSTIDPGSIRV